MTDRVDYAALRAELLARAEELVPLWLPGGQIVKGEWTCGDVRGGSGDSLKVHLRKGVWHDWAAADDTPEAGGDLIHLRAQQLGVSDHEAALVLWRELRLVAGSPPPAKPAARAATEDPDGVPVSPVPDDAPGWSWCLRSRDLGEAAAHWGYRDAAGRLLMIKVRWNLADGKTFRPYSLWRLPDGSLKWRAKGLPSPRPLYGLDRLAARPDAPVVVCEGEKATDAAGVLLPGWVAVCSENGSKNASHADWSALKGRRVLVWRDNDEPGAAFAADVARITGAAVLDLRALAEGLGLPELQKGDDAADLELDAADRTVLDGICTRALPAPAAPPAPASPPAKPKRQRTGGGNSYAAMVDALVDHIDALNLRPDALAGWRSLETGVRTETGDTEIAQAFAHHYRIKGEKLVDGELKCAFQVLVNEWRAERRAEIIARVTGKPATDAGRAELGKWVKAITGRSPSDEGISDEARAAAVLDLAVMRHWMWMVKRSALRRPVDWHIMPILKSTAHGTGKTTAVEILAAPFDELSFPIDATTLTDERKSLIVTTCLIGRWDEMAGSQKADQEALKRAITEKVHTFRELYTMSTHMRQRSCSFIGTANLPVDVLVQDTSGSRRFYEMQCVRCDFDLMNSVDALLAWQAVDEAEEAPITEHLEALHAHHDGIKHQDLVSLWLRDDNHWESRVIFRADQKDPQTIPALKAETGYRLDQWAARFRAWCVGCGQTMPPLPRFNLRLQQEGFVHKRVYLNGRSNDGREYRYLPPARLAAAMDGAAAPTGGADGF